MQHQPFYTNILIKVVYQIVHSTVVEHFLQSKISTYKVVPLR